LAEVNAAMTRNGKKDAETGAMMNQEQFVWRTAKEAATRARTSTKTIYREVSACRLRAARITGRRALRLRDDWIDAWLEGQSQPVESKPRSEREPR